MQITFDDAGQVKVGEAVLPGVFESLEIHGLVKVDQVEIPGKQEKVTQAVGYDNARIRLTVNLLPPVEGGTCEQQIAIYQQVFRKSAAQQKPGVYRIVNRHTVARGINEVIFSDLKTWEDNRSDKVLVICEFTEHVPIQVQVKQQPGPAPIRQPAPPAPKPPAQDYPDYATRLMMNKPAATPAKDDRKPGLGERVLGWIKGTGSNA